METHEIRNMLFVFFLFLFIGAILIIGYFILKKKKKDFPEIYLTYALLALYVIAFFCHLTLFFSYSEGGKWLGVIYSLAILGALGYACFKSFHIIKANQMGLRVTLGDPGDYLSSGPNVGIWPLQKIAHVPTSIQAFQFAAISVMTKRGRVRGYKEVIESAEISVLFTIYYYFRLDKLKQTIKNVPGFSKEDLAPELIPFALDVLRTLIGRTPWRLINEERYKFTQCALGRIWPLDKKEKNFKLHPEAVTESGKKLKSKPKSEPVTESGEKTVEDENHNLFLFSFDEIKEFEDERWIKEKNLEKSPFVQFGLEKVVIAIEDIDFTDDDLQKAVSAPEKARLNKTAQELKAKADSFTLKREGEGKAHARKKMLEAIQQHPDLEVLNTLKGMAQGETNTMFQIPSFLENGITKLLGNKNDIMTMFNDMEPEDRKFFQEFIASTISKRKAKGGK